MIKFMLITNCPEVAKYAEYKGVGRIFIDLEWNGKQERQGHLDTLISRHDMEDVAKVRAHMSKAELLVRLNPLYAGTKQEIDDAISGGADLLMLPMFRHPKELEEFSCLVNGRVGIIPLVETYAAAESMAEIVKIAGITEIFIGLNDLHLDMKLNFMFEPLANGYVDSLVDIIKNGGLPFGFGGIARMGEGIVPGEMILGEHLRLGSSSVILSRTFHRKSERLADFKENINLGEELAKLVSVGDKLKQRNKEQEIADYQHLKSVINKFVKWKTNEANL